jgi:hypothetical protein
MKLEGLTLCRRSGQQPQKDEKEYAPEGERRETVTGEMVCVRRKIDLEALVGDLQVRTFLRAVTLSRCWKP